MHYDIVDCLFEGLSHPLRPRGIQNFVYMLTILGLLRSLHNHKILCTTLILSWYEYVMFKNSQPIYHLGLDKHGIGLY